MDNIKQQEGLRKLPFYTMEERMSDIKNIKKANIDTKKIYRMPKFKVIEVQNKYLIIAYETGNWIVLENYIQMEIFKYLAFNKTIEETINKYSDNMDSIYKVLIQLKLNNLRVFIKRILRLLKQCKFISSNVSSFSFLCSKYI